MNKKFLIITSIIVSILIIGIVVVGISQNSGAVIQNPFSKKTEEETKFVNPIIKDNQSVEEDENQDNSSKPKPVIEKLNLTIEQISDLKTDYDCSFDIFQNSVSNTGKLYKSGNRVSLQYNTIDTSNTNTAVNMIRGTESTYIWDDKTALQFSNKVFDKSELPSQSTTLKALNSKSNIDFECTQSKPGDIYFTLPKDRKFVMIESILTEVNKSVSEIGPIKIEVDRSICSDLETNAETIECNQALDGVTL